MLFVYLWILLYSSVYSSKVETEVFDKMDDLVSKGKGDEAYRDLFHEM